MTALDQLRQTLEDLRRHHLVVEDDCWYSCPKSGECCNDNTKGGDCNCGADKHNAKVDAALMLLSQLQNETIDPAKE